jgi:hypothetical protein
MYVIKYLFCAIPIFYLNALMEGELRLPGAIDVRVLLRLHTTVVVIKHSFNDSITNRLRMIYQMISYSRKL